MTAGATTNAISESALLIAAVAIESQKRQDYVTVFGYMIMDDLSCKITA